MSCLASADVVFNNGLHLEGRMTKVFERMQQRRARTAAVAREFPDRLDWEEGEAVTIRIWFDVGLWMKAAETVRDTLTDMDPEHADVYRANAARYLDQLAELDRYVRRRAAEVPQPQRVLVTAHDAFHYFGRAYGFEVRGLQGVSTATEAGVGGVQTLADLIAERRIAAIFVESSVPARNIEAAGSGARPRLSVPSAEMFSTHGRSGNSGRNLRCMVRHNIDTIVNALTGREE
jgi:manganese/zinc/iron transport system substrate-binding protein